MTCVTDVCHTRCSVSCCLSQLILVLCHLAPGAVAFSPVLVSYAVCHTQCRGPCCLSHAVYCPPLLSVARCSVPCCLSHPVLVCHDVCHIQCLVPCFLSHLVLSSMLLVKPGFLFHAVCFTWRFDPCCLSQPVLCSPAPVLYSPAVVSCPMLSTTPVPCPPAVYHTQCPSALGVASVTPAVDYTRGVVSFSHARFRFPCLSCLMLSVTTSVLSPSPGVVSPCCIMIPSSCTRAPGHGYAAQKSTPITPILRLVPHVAPNLVLHAIYHMVS